jgi:Zn-dependent protease
MDTLLVASAWVLPVLLAVTLHEAAHGWVADKRGDDTARLMGRVTFNPLRHIDLFGTVILPGLLILFQSPFLFGYAKPVPVAAYKLHSPRRDMALVAAAGPLANLFLGIVSALAIRSLVDVDFPRDQVDLIRWVGANLFNSLQINAMLFVFNLLPLPPLDGGRILAGLLPPWLGARVAAFERKGMLILLLMLFILPMLGQMLGWRLNPLGWLVGVPADILSGWLIGLTGLSQ